MNRFNHTSGVAVVTPTDRPKSVRNCCIIEVFVGVFFVLSSCFLDFSVGVEAFVIGLSQISSTFFSSCFQVRTFSSQLSKSTLLPPFSHTVQHPKEETSVGSRQTDSVAFEGKRLGEFGWFEVRLYKVFRNADGKWFANHLFYLDFLYEIHVSQSEDRVGRMNCLVTRQNELFVPWA